MTNQQQNGFIVTPNIDDYTKFNISFNNEGLANVIAINKSNYRIQYNTAMNTFSGYTNTQKNFNIYKEIKEKK